MTKVKTRRKRMTSLYSREAPHSKEVSDLLKVLEAIEQVGCKAGCFLAVNKSDLAGQDITLLKEMQVLGARAEHLMLERIRPGNPKASDYVEVNFFCTEQSNWLVLHVTERTKSLECLISKKLSKTDVECQLTLTSVEKKLDDLRAIWGQHGQVLQVTDLTDEKEMEFTFVIWSHRKGHRAVLTGDWKHFCWKHSLSVGDEISFGVSNDMSNKYILRARESMDPLAVLECKEKTCPAIGDCEGVEATTTCSQMISGEAQDCEDMQGATASGESRSSAIIEDEKTAKIVEDEKVAELAEYLFRLSRWPSPSTNLCKS